MNGHDASSQGRAAALRRQLAELRLQYQQYAKIQELYNVSFDLESHRLEKAIAQCRQALGAIESAVSPTVG